MVEFAEKKALRFIEKHLDTRAVKKNFSRRGLNLSLPELMNISCVKDYPRTSYDMADNRRANEPMKQFYFLFGTILVIVDERSCRESLCTSDSSCQTQDS